MKRIGIIDVGIGNIAALLNAFKEIGCTAFVCKTVADIQHADSIVLCGAGHFESVMTRLIEAEFPQALIDCKGKKKILGICVGAQILGNSSEESTIPGLQLLNFQSVRFKPKKGFPVPNTGWQIVKSQSEDLDFGRMYFTHSYYFTDVDSKNVMATSYYDFEYPVLIEDNYIVAAQFHPEKSHQFGVKFLNYWISK